MKEAARPKSDEETGIPPENTATVQPVPKQCEQLAHKPDIIELFALDLRRLGVVGEMRIAKLLYLAITSRVLERPVSMAVKGPSSGGKSFTVEQVLRFFPASAYHVFTAMSEKMLVYTSQDLRHRFIVIYEAAGMGQFSSYLIRSLLSENRIDYEVVERKKERFGSRRLVKEGPTGLLVTTTKPQLHPENETRLLSVTVTDTPEQTRAVFQALAERNQNAVDRPDLAPWHALQEWIATADREVVIPYALRLAELVPPEATRLRRDFSTLLSLIKAHAILHQASRERDQAGRIVATLEDYAVVRELLADLMAEGVEAAVPPVVRETVNAVAALHADTQQDVTVFEVAQYLGLDKSSAWRRVKVAIKVGYLSDREWRQGQPRRLYVSAPIPEDREILPPVERLRGCSENGEVYPPAEDDDTMVVQ